MTNTERNKETVRATWEAFANGDLKTVFDNMSDDIRWMVPETTPSAWGLDLPREHRGKQAIMQFVFAGVAKVFPEGLAMRVRHIHGDGEIVITELTASGRLLNGKFYENDYCFVIQVVEGRIHHIREYLDTQKFKDVIGDDAIALQRQA